MDGSDKQLQAAVDVAAKQVQSKQVDGSCLVDEGGVVVVVAGGELGDFLLDWFCEEAARRRVKR